MGYNAGDTKILSAQTIGSQLDSLKESELTRRLGSMSNAVRYCILQVARVEDPALAKKWEEARVKRFAVNSAVLLVGLVSVTQTALCKSDTKRQRAGMVRPSMRLTVARAVKASRYFQFSLGTSA